MNWIDQREQMRSSGCGILEDDSRIRSIIRTPSAIHSHPRFHLWLRRIKHGLCELHRSKLLKVEGLDPTQARNGGQDCQGRHNLLRGARRDENLGGMLSHILRPEQVGVSPRTSQIDKHLFFWLVR